MKHDEGETVQDEQTVVLPPIDIGSKLRRRIASMEPGMRLPTVRELMAIHGVGQLKIQHALDHLKKEGLIESQVGRGTFVGSKRRRSTESRRVLVLAHELQTDRLDEIDKALHRAFVRRNWRSAVLTYSDFSHAMQLIEGGTPIDAAVVQPRGAMLPLEFLALLRRNSAAVVIEGFPVAGVDVDCVGVNWPAAVHVAMRHLVELGHRRIGYATMAHPNRLFRAPLEQFRQLRSWAGLSPGVDCEIMLPEADEDELFEHLARELVHRGREAFTAMVIYPGPFHGDRLLQALARANLRVPDDISVAMIGFNDIKHENIGRLTTIGHSVERLTELVAVAIEQRWSAPTASYEAAYLTPELVDHGSTKRIG
jgi:DNA-binding LacI/PurR family transcriptional regulator